MLKAHGELLMGKVLFCLRSPYFLTFIFIMLILLIGLGQVARWDLLDQVAMADNYFKEGRFYPALSDPSPHGVSVYFPGVSFLVVALRKVGFDFYLVEVSLLISTFIVLSFFYIQMKIAEMIVDTKIFWYQFAPFIIAFCLFLTPQWLTYAVEFKPDTIGLLIGYIGLYVAGFLAQGIAFHRLIFGALLFSGAIIFKQQYVALIAGILAFCVAFPNKSRLLFMCLTVSFLSIILLLLFDNPSVWFWNVEILANDGFLSVTELARANFTTIKTLILSLICCGFFLKLSEGTFPIWNKEYLVRACGVPWMWGSAFFVVASFLSAIKNGGNAGNTQLGIVLCVPLVYALLSRLPQVIFITLAWAAVIISFPGALERSLSYRDAVNLRSFVTKDIVYYPAVILTGSNVYFASRHYPARFDSINYWKLSSRDNTSVRSSLSYILPHIAPDRLVVENWPMNKTAINSDPRYKIIFENRLGLVAKRIQ